MSSFKKLRLDPELPPTHRNLSNQPGANDSGGRGFLDGSSFSSSTSGGSGAYGRSSGPFRTRYSQPLGAPSTSSTSFSRFAPYYFGKERRTSLRVPLIRARRDDSDSEGYRPSSRASLNSSLGGDSTSSATSSTAQRIIETLQNLSTPVMNAGKIRIDQDIKAVQPLTFGGGTPLSRISPGGSLSRSTGPPKMCSSLLLSNPSPSNQSSPMFNSGDQRRLFCIPRMVDVSTNTEKEEVSSPSQSNFLNKPTPTASSKSPLASSTALKTGISTTASKDENIDEDEGTERRSGFTFSSPWAPDIFYRYLSSVKDDKSVSKGNLGIQQPLINGFKETTPSPPMFSSKNTSTFTTSMGSSPLSSPISSMKQASGSQPISFGGIQGGVSGFGSSPLKDSISVGKPVSEIKTDTLSPFGSGKIGSITTGSSGSSTFNFGSKGPSGHSSSSQPQRTFSFGNSASNDAKISSSDDKVDAGKPDNSLLVKSPLVSGAESTSKLPPLSMTMKSSGTKWRCSVCMVENDVAIAACVCCSEKNPNATVAAPNAVKKKWRCPTCMVENELEAATCVCCSEKNPNLVADKKESSTAAGTAPAPTFKFGISNPLSGPSSVSSSTSSFTFGAPKPAQSDIQNTSFKFGAPVTTTSASSNTLSTPVTSSSLQSAATTITPVPFGFGNSSSPSSSLPADRPQLGFSVPETRSSQAAAATTTANTTTTSASNVFSTSKLSESNSVSNTSAAGSSIFGSTNNATFQSPQPASSGGFGFPSTTTTSSETQKPPASSFSFGSGSKAPFGSNNTSFGSGQQNQSSGLPGATPSLMTPAASTPSTFSFGGSNNPPTASPFGFNSNTSQPQPSSGGLFQLPGSTPATKPQAPSLAPPTPSFSLSPNINFGATPGNTIPLFGNPTQPIPNAGSQPPMPPLFQFSGAGANPNASDSPGGGRKIKKAIRRFNK